MGIICIVNGFSSVSFNKFSQDRDENISDFNDDQPCLIIDEIVIIASGVTKLLCEFNVDKSLINNIDFLVVC